MGWATGFLCTFFPELCNEKLSVTVRDTLNPKNELSFHLFSLTVETNGSQDAASSEVVLPFTSKFEFRRDGLFHGWRGPRPQRFKSAVETVENNPHWTDEEIDRMLVESGALYPPQKRAEFINSLPLSGARALWGELRLDEVVFVRRNEVAHAEGLHPFAEMEWYVHLEVWHAGEKWYGYSMYFEPYSGKLLHMGMVDTPKQ